MTGHQADSAQLRAAGPDRYTQNSPFGAASKVIRTACHNVPNGGYLRGRAR
jgi:hypothetical protein